MLWARSEAKVNQTISKFLVIHNIPDLGDTDVLFRDMTNFVFKHEILSFSPLYKLWLLEFSNLEAASTILNVYKKRQMPIEWATRKHYTCKVDTDAELRLQCVANYWEMPVFIYGRVVRSKAIQTVAVSAST